MSLCPYQWTTTEKWIATCVQCMKCCWIWKKQAMIIHFMDNQRAGCSCAAKLTSHSLVKSQGKDWTSNAKKCLLCNIDLDKSMPLEFWEYFMVYNLLQLKTMTLSELLLLDQTKLILFYQIIWVRLQAVLVLWGII